MIRRAQSSPKFRCSCGSEVEFFRKHANDCVRDAVQRDRLSEHIPISAKPLLPGPVTEDHGPKCARCVLADKKIAADDWRNTERKEEAGAYARTGGLLCSVASAQREATVQGVRIHRHKGVISSLPVEKVEVRNQRAPDGWCALEQRKQAAWLCVRQLLNERRVDNTKHGDAGRHSQHNKKHDESESAILAQLSKRVAQVLKQAVHFLFLTRTATLAIGSTLQPDLVGALCHAKRHHPQRSTAASTKAKAPMSSASVITDTIVNPGVFRN